ncbi:MAG: hypothetical protein IMY77_02465, partial [Chloroflexi bacterium]|nr:hypothetical protein [Chloroflexota bacterium]
MTKRKAKTLNKPRGKTKGRQADSGLFHFPAWRVVWRIILIAVIIGILSWQWQTLASWAASVRDQTWGFFGWGLLLLTIALITLGIALWYQKSSPLIVRFRQWWGGIAFTLAIWGILAYFVLGGRFGQYLISYQGSTFIGIPRIAGLILTGTVLVAPGAFAHAIKKTTSWLSRQFQRRPAPQP